ncbi:hypothetical protein HBH52_199540 [Parastagonospora nodorum]|nr:hypothetical protein HBH52_199540 [Parastagonospora nodorum]
MSAQYQAVSAEDSRLDSFAPICKRSHNRCWIIPLGTISVANVLMLLASLYFWRAAEHASSAVPALPTTTLGLTSEVEAVKVEIPDGLAHVRPLSTAYVSFHWNTPWGAPNATDADRLWENINTAHGHIAIDHAWASENNWPESMDIPGQPGKGLYLLQAYHQLHCLRIVRSTLLSLSRKTPPKYPMHHALHCFDALRQHIMCHADSTPLYGKGDRMAGDGQLHQCRDWNELRDYATKNTACFRDHEPGMSYEDLFSVCDDGTDGLEQL